MIDFERLIRTLTAHDVAFVIVGGVAATLHGSARLTTALDVVYARDRENLQKLVSSLAPLKPYLRGAPAGLPFHLDEAALRGGLNFTLITEAGPIDLLGEMTGVGGYSDLEGHTKEVTLFGSTCRCIDIETLTHAKRAAGRPKDLDVVAELEAIREESDG